MVSLANLSLKGRKEAAVWCVDGVPGDSAFKTFSVWPGQKLPKWILKRANWRWSWWRMMIRAGSRSTRLCSGWTAPGPASTCGSVLWSTTPSSGCGRRETANPTDRTSSGWGLASGSAGGRNIKRPTAPGYEEAAPSSGSLVNAIHPGDIRPSKQATRW